MGSYKQIDVFSDMIALNLGIVHPTVACAGKDDRPRSIDEAIASMTKDESRVCRRKFRKLLRSILSKKRWNRMSTRAKRGEAMMEVRRRAWNQIVGKHNYELADNDE